jgi:hypothetical protein
MIIKLRVMQLFSASILRANILFSNLFSDTLGLCEIPSPYGGDYVSYCLLACEVARSEDGGKAFIRNVVNDLP